MRILILNIASIILFIMINICCVTNTKSSSLELRFSKKNNIRKIQQKVESILNNTLTDIETIMHPRKDFIKIISDCDCDKGDYGFTFINRTIGLNILINIFKEYNIFFIETYEDLGNVTKERIKKIFQFEDKKSIVVVLKNQEDLSYLIFKNLFDVWYLDEFYFSNFEYVKKFM